jgi:hypothetical protein
MGKFDLGEVVGGGIPKLIVFKEHYLDIPVKGTITATMEGTESNHFDLRSIRIRSDTLAQVELYETPDYSGYPVYTSLIDREIYDILNLPVVDDGEQNSIYLKVKNYGDQKDDVYVEIRITTLI